MDDMPVLDIVPVEAIEEEVIVSYEDLADDSLPTQDIFVKKPHPTNDKKPKDIPERAVKKKVVRIKLPEEEEEEPEDGHWTQPPEEPEEAINIVIEEPPKKKKKPLSEKQRLHLQKARVKALEKKKAIKLKKEQISKKVAAEVEEQIYSQKVAPPAPKQDGFEIFLNHMSQFKNYETMHLAEQNAKREKEADIKSKINKIISPPQPNPPPKIITQKPKNIYASAFEW